MLEALYGEQMPSDDAREMLDDIKNSSIRLISIVNQFLTTSRLEQKRAVFDTKPIDIAANIRTCVNDLQALADEKKLKLIIDVPDDLPKALADEMLKLPEDKKPDPAAQPAASDGATAQ